MRCSEFLTSLEKAEALQVVVRFQQLCVICGFVENTYGIDFDHFERAEVLIERNFIFCLFDVKAKNESDESPFSRHFVAVKFTSHQSCLTSFPNLIVSRLIFLLRFKS